VLDHLHRGTLVELLADGRFAPIPVTHELIGVFVKSYRELTPFFMCHERADKFLPRSFLFFLESISQIRENEQKLGRMLFSQATFCCGMTP
jgi:hypothetical protein